MDVELTYVTGARSSGAVVCGCFAGGAAGARLVAGVGLVAALGTQRTRVSPEVLARHTPHYNTNHNLYCQSRCQNYITTPITPCTAKMSKLHHNTNNNLYCQPRCQNYITTPITTCTAKMSKLHHNTNNNLYCQPRCKNYITTPITTCTASQDVKTTSQHQ